MRKYKERMWPRRWKNYLLKEMTMKMLVNITRCQRDDDDVYGGKGTEWWWACVLFR